MEICWKWKRVFNSLVDPMTILPLFLGIFFAFMTFQVKDEIKTLFTVISAIGLGIGVNYFTFYYKEEKEKSLMISKAEQTVRSLNLTIKTILRRTDADSVENRNTIDSLLNAIDSWKDIYSKADISQIEKLNSLRKEIELEPDLNKKSEKQNEYNSTVTTVTTAGLDSYIALSGDTKNQLLK